MIADLDLIGLLSVLIGTTFLLFLWYAAFVSRREEEPRAAVIALFLSLLLSMPYFTVGLSSFEYRTPAAVVLFLLTAAGSALLFLPRGGVVVEPETPRTRFDERDTMFSRSELREGTPAFTDYYRAHPDRKQLDDRFRGKPGLLSEHARYHDPCQFAAAEAAFTAVEAFHRILDKAPSFRQLDVGPDEVMSFLRHWMLMMGGLSVGVTELRDYHLYTTLGRGDRYGRSVDTGEVHDYAIAITVEMDRFMIDRAPYGPVVMESARRYLRSGAIAVQVAEIIRSLGYSARAHIDGNYHVVCPLVARDAGLGEIGRMGLLMTPEVGPRARISVVTTSLPLRPDPPRYDSTVIEFCRRCRKCAAVCPARAIPFDDRAEMDGVKRWKINAETCYTYWCVAGTDCGRCVSVCPYAHPKNRFHDLIRAGVRRSPAFRRFAVVMDDLFYGRKPAPRLPPGWMRSPDRAGTADTFVREDTEE